MENLNNLEFISQIDQSNMRSSVGQLADQCQQTLADLQKIKISSSLRKADKIVLGGMGGSALGGHLVQTLFKNQLTVPFEIVNGYDLPAYVDQNTLVILSSYSGGTEEVLNQAGQALSKKSKIIYITTGGLLSQWGEQNKIDGYVFDPKYNICGQPRMALGYSIFGVLGILQKLKFISLNQENLDELWDFLNTLNKKWRPQNFSDNTAKILSQEIYNKLPLVIGTEIFGGNAHIFANQLNENAKTPATYFLNPEICHHFLEGLVFPADLLKKLHFIFLQSNYFNRQNNKRLEVIKKLLQNKKISFSSYMACGKTSLQQSIEMLYLGSYISFYLALLYHIDPSPIPSVNFVKQNL